MTPATLQSRRLRLGLELDQLSECSHVKSRRLLAYEVGQGTLTEWTLARLERTLRRLEEQEHIGRQKQTAKYLAVHGPGPEGGL